MTGSFDYTDYELVNPEGTNKLSSYAMYYQRSLYEERLYPRSGAVPIDLYYNKQLYGKVDPNQRTIVTSPSNLASISSAQSSDLFALSPVVFAFEKFVAHMRKANIMGVARDAGNPKLYDIKAHHAYAPPVQQYKAFLEGIWKVYYANFTPMQDAKVIDFASFAADYRKHLLETVQTYPITQTDFLLTPSVTPFSTAMAIGIDDGDCGDDNYKYVNYLSDPNYDFYTKAAKKFGFIVDRNAPWILWADVHSPAFYMNLEFFFEEGANMPVTRDTFFEAFYTHTWRSDLSYLYGAFEEAYRTLVHHKPFYEHQPATRLSVGGVGNARECGRRPEPRSRPPYSPSQRAAVLTDKFMLDLYIDLRHTEIVREDVSKTAVRHRAYELYRSRLDSSLTPLENAIQYVDEVYSKYVYTVQNVLTAFPDLQRIAEDELLKSKGYI